MSQEFDDLTANLLTSDGRKKAPSRMSLSGFLGRNNRQSTYQVEEKGQVESRSKPSKPLKGRVLSALGLRTPLKTDGIDNKIKELTGILEKVERKRFYYTNGEDNHNNIKANLQEQIAGYESYKNNIRNATTQGNLEYILPAFQKLEEKLTVLQKMEELYDLENLIEHKRYSDDTDITYKKKLVSQLVSKRIGVSIKILEKLERLDSFKEPDYIILGDYLKGNNIDMTLQILVELTKLLILIKDDLKPIMLSKSKAIIKETLEKLLGDDIFKELLELELLTNGILTIKDLDDILTTDDLKELKRLLENYEHSELKDLQKLKELYKKDKLLISMLNNVEYHVNGGRKASVKKEICGKLRCIYTIAGSRKEHVKYKGRLITVADYKRIHKIRKV
jgi:hypothetical protein